MGLAMGSAGIYVIATRREIVGGDLIGLATALTLLLCAAFYSGILFGRPMVVIDERGITNHATLAGSVRFLAWSQIGRVFVRQYGRNTQIAVSTRDGERVHMGPFTRLNRALSRAEMYIPTLLLPVSINEMLDEISAFAPREVRIEYERHAR
jgi:hypothetical protein